MACFADPEVSVILATLSAGIDTVHVAKSESAPHNFASTCEIIVHNN
jgi:hypothetical protein